MDSNIKLLLFTGLSITAFLSLASGMLLVWPAPTLENGLILLAFLAPTVCLAIIALKRDPLTFYKYVIGLFFAAAAIQGLAALAEDASLLTRVLPAVWTGVGLVGVVWLRSRLGRVVGLPNVIGQQMPGVALFEQEGIHFAGAGISGARPSVAIYIQNCWDADRDVTVVIEELGANALQIPTLEPIHLGPGCVGLLSVPLGVARPGAHLLNVELSVSGVRGKRVRPYRGLIVQPRINPGRFLLHLMMGGIAWGGGTRVPLTSIEVVEKPIARNWEILWEWKDGRGWDAAAVRGRPR